LIRKPNTPAPRKFQNPTEARNSTAHRCGNAAAPPECCRLPSCRNDHASTVSSVSGMTSAAEKKAPSAISTAGPPLK